MRMMKKLREFAIKGNVIDLAIGVIIGVAFGKVVDFLVSDPIMLMMSKVFGIPDFFSYYILLNNQGFNLPLTEARKAGAVFAYGNLTTVSLCFLALPLVLFLLVWTIKKLKGEKRAAGPAKTPKTSSC